MGGLHSLASVWPYRHLLVSILFAGFVISLPLHLNRAWQLRLSYDVRGRGVLWLTVIELRFGLFGLGLVLLQTALIAADRPLPGPPCIAFSWLVDMLNVQGVIGGTGIVLCRYDN